MSEELEAAVERPDWMRPDFRYPEPSEEHKATMADLKARRTFIDYTSEMNALRDALSASNARALAAEEALRARQVEMEAAAEVHEQGSVPRAFYRGQVAALDFALSTLASMKEKG